MMKKIEDWSMTGPTQRILLYAGLVFAAVVITVPVVKVFSKSHVERVTEQKEDMFIKCLTAAGRMSADAGVVEQCRKTADQFYPPAIVSCP